MDELSPADFVSPFPLLPPPLDTNPRCKNAWSQVVRGRGRGHGYLDGESSFQIHSEILRAEAERQALQAEECRSRQGELGDGDGLTASQRPCEPLCAERGKQIVHEEESRLPQKQQGDGEGNTASQKPDDPLCVEKKREAEGCRQKEQHGDGYSDGDGETARQKGKPSAKAEESQNQQEQEVELHCGQAGITQAIVAEPEKKQVSNSIAQRPQTVNGLLDDASAFSGKTKEGESIATPPKAAWRTLEAEARVSLESGFVMEAASWPTLAEARNTKPSEARNKSASSKEATSTPSQPSLKVSASQGPSTETLRHSSAYVKGNPSLSGSGAKYKSPFKQGNITGNGKPSFPASENIPSPRMLHHIPGANVLLPDQSIKSYGLIGMKGFPAAPHQAPGHGSFHYRREEGGMAPIPNNSASWHNNMRAYGRGHPGWHHHGRGHDKHAGFLRPREQHIGPRNVHPPFTPFMNINPAYYNIPNYQRGNMYYMAASAPDFNHNHTYFGPSGPPGGVMHGPDLVRIRAMLQKQIEYYFSTQNLCKDMYLRSRMDDEGFVPVSLIASFKRVQVLTSSPVLILEALQMSSVVEVKGDRIRRSHDWRRWLMPKPSSSSSSQACCIENVNSFVPTRTDRVNGQVNYILEKSGEHCFNGSSMLQVIRLEDATSTGTSDGQKSGDTCCAHGIETKDRIDGDISSVSSTGQLNSVTSTEEQLGWNCLDHSGTYQESSISHGPFGNGDGDAGISEGFINAGGDSFPASVLLQYGPSSIGKNGTACEQVNSSNSIPQREITMDSDILAEETKQKNFSCSTNSSLSDEDSCPSFAEPVYLSKSHKNNEDRVEVNDRRLITVTHAQLSSCIAVP